MRSRNIKPGFYRDADLAKCSMPARLIAPGLWMMADREGRIKDCEAQIKMELLPCDDIDIGALLNELETAKHIFRYAADDGGMYIQIRNFTQHQNPHKNEPSSKIPAYGGNSRRLAGLPEHSNKLDTLPEHSSNYQSTPADSLIPDSLIPEVSAPSGAVSGKRAKTVATTARAAKIPFEKIIEYLNQKTGKNFNPLTDIYRNHIKARWNQGLGLKDFLTVIDIKVAEWGQDAKMFKYLRPETLFGTKMPTYLQDGVNPRTDDLSWLDGGDNDSTRVQ